MKISNRQWFRIKEILFIVAFWVVSLEIYVFVRFYGWVGLNSEFTIFQIPFSLSQLLILSSFGGLLIGMLTGSFEILVVNRKLSHRPFGEMVFIKALVYLIVIMAVLFLERFISYTKFNKLNLIENEKAFDQTIQFFLSFDFLPLLIYAVFISIMIGVLLQVNQKFGPGILWNLFLGKYHRPKEEERIFMFLDLTSSTAIAEKLGHVQYSRLIQDCFQDLSDVLLDFRAHVYQFVGDEAVLTWNMREGLENANCIRIFYGFNERLQSRQKHYLKRYDHFPKFKASINIGIVSVAEVGDVKSEIAYHGDVLNTGARILEQCEHLQKNLLISGFLEKRIDNSELGTRFLTSIQLRGKKEEVNIYSIEQDGLELLTVH